MKRVVITGIGVVTSIGIGKEEFWKNLIAGKSGISPVTAFDTSEHFTHLGGEVKGFSFKRFFPEIDERTISRASQLGLTASFLAYTNSNLNTDILGNKEFGICMGTTLGSVQVVEIIDELIVKQNLKKFDDLICLVPTHTTPVDIGRYNHVNSSFMMFSTACAAGNYAIGYGYDLIKMNRLDIAIVGGADPFSKVAFTGFNQFKAVAPERCQPFDKNRKGMMVAEGAGVLILEEMEHALKRGVHVYAEVVGYGLSCDAKHMTSPSVEGIVQCMKKALKEAQITPEDIDYISAHGTGTPANDRTECAAIREVFGERYREIPVSSIKSMLGHTMGAASAIEAVACTLAIKHGVLPPTINFETPDPECDIDCVPNKARKHEIKYALNNSYAFGGNNASVVLKRFIE